MKKGLQMLLGGVLVSYNREILSLEPGGAEGSMGQLVILQDGDRDLPFLGAAFCRVFVFVCFLFSAQS